MEDVEWMVVLTSHRPVALFTNITIAGRYVYVMILPPPQSIPSMYKSCMASNIGRRSATQSWTTLRLYTTEMRAIELAYGSHEWSDLEARM